MKTAIDLNADLGEGAASERELLGLISSASIACGFHAGDPAGIFASLHAARAAGVAIGAHPSLADRENFGRQEAAIEPDEAFALVAYQVGAIKALATSLGVRLRHVKPHGALYHMAAREAALAEAVVHAVLTVDRSLLLFAPGGSALDRAASSIGLAVAREVFADRNYQPDGSLVPRQRPDALLHDPGQAAERIMRILREGVVEAVDGKAIHLEAETVCLHGDTPEAVEFARCLRAKLEEAGIAVEAPTP